jgi:CHAT domain-containing protein
MAALRRVMAVVDEQQASLGATELRAGISVHAGQAAMLGLRLALDTGRPACVLGWMERSRANSLRRLPARPPRDEVLAGLLAELRRVGEQVAGCATTGADPAPLVARQVALERAVRERAWQSAGASGEAARRNGGAGAVPAPSELRAALRGAALLELAELDGALHAVVVARDRTQHRALVAAGEVRAELGQLRLAMRRLAYGSTSGFASGAGEQLARSAARLEQLLLSPVASLLGSGPLVIVPSGDLHALPWPALPLLAGRAVSVAPSGALWLESSRDAAAPGERRARHDGERATPAAVVVVAGPRLPGAAAEAAAVASLHAGATLLVGRRAGVARVLAALEGAELAHLAAHGNFRADNALWSSIELADGALTVYELEQLRRPPPVVVLSACQSGLSAVQPGDELMGLVASLLTLGTRTVIASVAPVEDRASALLMAELHRRMRSGETPAQALAGAQSVSADPASAAFVCFGAG